jgi:peptidoglycan/LPS O-acetylase OafA/YrhL
MKSMAKLKINDWLTSKLRRVTTSVAFIPEIDGLRFLSILMVVLVHVNGIIVAKSPFVFTKAPDSYGLISGFAQNGGRGVLLFFAISGFVLSLPFAKHFLNKDKPVNIKSYFLRRITRIEPPYIINAIVIFFYLLIAGKDTLANLWPGLVSALFYLNNNFKLGPSINAVAWSLEIEVQFYILAPLLCYVFLLPKNYRRMLLALLIILLPVAQFYFPPGVKTIYSYLQYFLVGFLLVDLYVGNFNIILPKIMSIIIGILSFFAMFFIKDIASWGEIIFLFSIFVFYFLALNDKFWKKIFSAKYLTIIGGMCYTIYLWHSYILSAIINKTAFLKISNSYLSALFLQCLISLPLLLLFSTILYLLIERPCMNKNWPKDLINFIRKKR